MEVVLDVLTLALVAAQFTPFGNIVLSLIGLYKLSQTN